jgi:hypothetical protein
MRCVLAIFHPSACQRISGAWRDNLTTACAICSFTNSCMQQQCQFHFHLAASSFQYHIDESIGLDRGRTVQWRGLSGLRNLSNNLAGNS